MRTREILAIPRITAEPLAELVAGLPCGKRVGQALYVHRETLQRCATKLFLWVEALGAATGAGADFNVIKFALPLGRISFLSYPDFFVDPHPGLKASVTIHLETGRVTRQDYAHNANVPILHRKESLIETTHPRYAEWKALTEAEERQGLYQKPHKIGLRKNWERLLAQKGLAYRGHQLVKAQDDSHACMKSVEELSDQGVTVYRHKTALVRYGLSKPIQCLIGDGLLSEKHSLLDYGCGRGDDVRYLSAMGYQAFGWDPVYCPQGPREAADIVNLGYVLNVIEEPRERMHVLRDAYALARRLLVVSVLTPGSASAVSGRPYKDGILTKRNTFQKYFRQHELEAFIEDVLGTTAVPAALGVFYVFRDPRDLQDFLSRRSRRGPFVTAGEWKTPFSPTILEPGSAQARSRRKASLYQENQELLDAFWQKTLELGRPPLESEFDRYDALCALLGSPRKALRFAAAMFGSEALDKAAEARRRDLLVYVALSNFRKRVPFEVLPEGLQADIRFFFGSYPKALAKGREALFAAGNPDLVARLCDETPFGHKDHQALYVHSSLVKELHPILRVYVGCAEFLCGEVKDADIVKIHKHSGKISLLFYDDFFGNPLPELQTRVKVNLRTREVEIFDHRSDVRQELLFFKELYVAPGHPDRERWTSLSRALQDLGLEMDKGYGPSKQDLLRIADQHPWLLGLLDSSDTASLPAPSEKETGFSVQK